MTTRDLLWLVLANLKRMRVRVALTSVGVLIGTAAIVVLVSLAVGLQASATAEIGSFGDLTAIQVFAGSPFGFMEEQGPSRRKVVLDDATLERIRGLDHVVAVSPQVNLQGAAELRYGRARSWVSITGIEPRTAAALGWKLASGEARLGGGQLVVGPSIFELGEGPMFYRGPGVVVTSSGRRPTPEVPLQGRTVLAELTRYDDEGKETRRTVRFRIAGVFERGAQNDYSVYAALADVEAYNQWFSGRRRNPRDGWDLAIVKVNERSAVAGVEQAIRDLGFTTISSEAILRSLNQVFRIMQAILGAIGGVALLVAAVGIANTMTMAIYERTREIGVMKAVGATNRDVLHIFLAEAGAIGFVGGLLGVLTGWLVGQGINIFVLVRLQAASGAQGGSSPTTIQTPLWLALFALAFATAVGLTSGVYPALRAASMRPLTALRTE